MLREFNILFFLVPNLRCDYSSEDLGFTREDISNPTAHTIHAETMVSESRTRTPIMQWHVGIYDVTMKPYTLVCGGSVVKRDTVISAAHCFWEEGIGMLKEAAQFLAAAGKVQREYEAHGEEYMQRSKITDIYIPTRFRGLVTNYADDLAVLRLDTPFEYGMAVQPVCVGFEPSLESQVLHQDSAGTMLGWGLAQGDDMHYLKSVLLPFIEPHQCFSYTESNILKWLTRDKMCAGFWGADLVTCRGDSGGGLVFNYHLQNIQNPNMMTAPYLIGVASIAQREDGEECHAHTLGVFTQLTFHKKFIEKHVPGTVEACSEVYRSNKQPIYVADEEEYEPRKEELPDYDTSSNQTQNRLPMEVKRIPYPVPPAAPMRRIPDPLPEPVIPGLQWHAAIYFKTGEEYKYVCGGSIIKRDVIISAASCFYDEKLQTILAPYVATAGKQLKVIDAGDKYAQFSVVKTVKIPETYTGSNTNYQDNIAVVHLAASFRYTAGVQPVCISFDPALTFWDQWRDSDGQPTSTQQLTGWSLSGDYSPIHLESRPLLLLDPSLALHGSFFMKFITRDKICAGLWPLALALCDNGAGLTHHSFINSTLVPYLFAVASTMQGLDEECKVPKYAPAIFTVIRPHKEFLRKNVQGLEKECTDVYVRLKEHEMEMLDSQKPERPKHARKDLQTTLFKDSSEPRSPEAVNRPAPAVPAAADNATLAPPLRVRAGINGTIQLPEASASNRTHKPTQNALFKDSSEPRSSEAENQPAPAVPAAADNATLAPPLRVRAGVNGTVQLPEASASNRTHNATQNADTSEPRSPEAEKQPAPAVPAAADNATLAPPLLPEASASNGTYNETQNAESSQPRSPEAEKQPAPAVPAAADNATLAPPLLPEASASNGTYNETQNADPSQPRSPEAENRPAPAVPAAADNATLATPLLPEASASNRTLNATQNALFEDSSEPRSSEAEKQPAPLVPAAPDNATLATPLLPEASASNRTLNATQNALFEDSSEPRSSEAEKQPAPAVPAAAHNATLAPPLLPEASASNRTLNATQNAESSQPRSPEAEKQPAPAVPAAADNATLAPPLLPEASASNRTLNATQNAESSQPRSPEAEKQPAPAVPAAADNATLAPPLLPEASASNRTLNATQNAESSQPRSSEAENRPAPAVPAAAHNATLAPPLLPEASASNGTYNATQNADPPRPRSPEAENQPAPLVPAAADNATLAPPLRVRAGVNGTVQLPEASASNRTHNATQNASRNPEPEKQPAPAIAAAADNATLAPPLLLEASASNGTYNETQNADTSEPRSLEVEIEPAPAVPAAADNATLAPPLRVRAGVNGTVQLPEASASNRTQNATQNALFKDSSEPRSLKTEKRPALAVPAAAHNATLAPQLRMRAGVNVGSNRTHKPTQNALFKDSSEPRSPEAVNRPAPAVLAAENNATLATPLRVRAGVNVTVQLPEASASNRTHKLMQNALFKDSSQPRNPEAVKQPAPLFLVAADNATLGDNAARARRRQPHRPQNALFKDPSQPRSPEPVNRPAPAVPAAADNATLAPPLRVRAGVNGTVQLPEARSEARRRRRRL